MSRSVPSWLGRHWFLGGMALVVALAWSWPEPTTFIERWRLLEILIGVVFLNSGLTLQTRRLLKGVADVKSFAAIQACVFVVFPVLMGASARWLFPDPQDLTVGMGVLLAVPTTISSCVILTTIAGGATEVALFSAVAGNLLGVFVSPLLLTTFLGMGGSAVGIEIKAGPMIVTLLFMVLLPVLAGQIARRFAPEFFGSCSKPFSKFNQCVILLIIYASAAKAIPRLSVAPTLLLAMTLYTALFHVVMLGVANGAARLRGGDKSLGPAILFCGSQKTLAIGQAIAASVAAQTGQDLSLIMAPMVLYHLCQLIIDAIVAQRSGVR